MRAITFVEMEFLFEIICAKSGTNHICKKYVRFSTAIERESKRERKYSVALFFIFVRFVVSSPVPCIGVYKKKIDQKKEFSG